MNKNSLILLCALLGYSLPAFADKPLAPAEIQGAVGLNAEAVVDLVTTRPDLIVVDSRRKDEYDKGHIEGAFNILDIEMTVANLAKIAKRKDTPLLFYCNGEHCMRSSNAAKSALQWGYSKVYWFRGGWQEWTDKNLPVAK